MATKKKKAPAALKRAGRVRFDSLAQMKEHAEAGKQDLINRMNDPNNIVSPGSGRGEEEYEEEEYEEVEEVEEEEDNNQGEETFGDVKITRRPGPGIKKLAPRGKKTTPVKSKKATAAPGAKKKSTGGRKAGK